MPNTLETIIAAALLLLSYLTAIGALILMTAAIVQTPISPFLFAAGLLLVPVAGVLSNIAESLNSK